MGGESLTCFFLATLWTGWKLDSSFNAPWQCRLSQSTLSDSRSIYHIAWYFRKKLRF